MALLSQNNEGLLHVEVDAVTNIVWTLDSAQLFIETEFCSPMFQVGNDEFCLAIFRDKDKLSFCVSLCSFKKPSFSLYCELLTQTGDKLRCLSGEIDQNKSFRNHILKFSYVYRDELLRLIGNHQTVKLVATFIPVRPFSYLERSTCEEGAGVCEFERNPSVEFIGAELKNTTQPGVTAYWTIGDHGLLPTQNLHSIFGKGLWSLGYHHRISNPFELGEDTFELVFGSSFGGDVFVGVERKWRETKPALTSFRWTVWNNDDTILWHIFVPRFDFHLHGNHKSFIMKNSVLGKLLHVNDELRIVCSLFQEEEDCLEIACRQGLNSLTSDFKELLVTGQDSDITIEVGEEKIFGHKAILSMRCPFFANRLRHNMAEKNTGVFNIPRYTAGEFKDFLLYLYTGRVESFTTQKALSLYRAADEFDVPVLKAECTEFMKSNLPVENLGYIMALSLKYDEKELWRIAEQFFKANCLEVLESASWKMFEEENFDEANEICMTLPKGALLYIPFRLSGSALGPL